MKCIWQMDGDKVKGFKCDFSPVDMLIVVSGLKYITADIERHPKDRERAQGIYNQIMLGRYHDEVDRKTEPQTDCEDVWRAGYKTGYDKGFRDAQKVKDSQELVKDLVKAFCEDGTWLERQGVYTLALAEAKQRAIDIIESVSAKTEPSGYNLSPVEDEPAISKMEQVEDEPQTEREGE